MQRHFHEELDALKQTLLAMGALVEDQIRRVMRALVERDEALALDVCARDSEVDALKEQVFRELLTFMMGDPKTIARALHLILVSRFLERVADHATNIAEMVVYMIEGKIVRHTLA